MFDAGGSMERVRSLIVGVDDIARPSAENATWIAGMETCVGWRIDGLQRGYPAVLGKVIVIQPETGANHSAPRLSRRVSHANPRAKCFAIVMSCARKQRYSQRLQSEVCGIAQLVSARPNEKAEGSVIAQAVTQREVRGGTPGILEVQSEPLYVLGKAAVPGGCERRVRARRIGRQVLRSGRIATDRDGGKICGV